MDCIQWKYTWKPLWYALSGLATGGSHAPWPILGDFDVVLNFHDRINGVDISRYETQDFESFFI